jgi:hypothetical protein
MVKSHTLWTGKFISRNIWHPVATVGINNSRPSLYQGLHNFYICPQKAETSHTWYDTYLSTNAKERDGIRSEQAFDLQKGDEGRG